MRKVRKSRSPADVAKHGHTALSLKQAERDLRDLLTGKPLAEHAERARSAYDDVNKGKVRTVLLVDQRHLCVYCEVDIQDDVSEVVIAHWHPVSQRPEDALHWDNLYLSCRGHDSCDGKQGSRMLADPQDADPLPWPSQTDYEDWIGFTSGGEIYARKSKPIPPALRRALHLAFDDQKTAAGVRPSLLGLNCPALREARKAAMDSERSHVAAAFPNMHAPDHERQRRANKLLAAQRRPRFVSIRVAWLRKELGNDRP